MKHLSLLLCLLSLIFQSCDFSDSETEKKLDGTWRHTEIETEDGEEMK